MDSSLRARGEIVQQREVKLASYLTSLGTICFDSYSTDEVIDYLARVFGRLWVIVESLLTSKLASVT